VAETAFTERDARAVLAAAIDIADAARAGVDVTQLLDLVAAVVRCDAASWSNMDKLRQVELQGGCNINDEDFDAEAYDAFGHQHPLCNGPMPALVSWADVVNPSEWHRTDLYNQCYRPIGYRHEIILQLGNEPGGCTNNVLLGRLDDHDFDERDRGLLWLLRPHLEAALRPAERDHRLTSRQKAVLTHVREGYTNAQIARRLGVTPGTIRGHLEDIFDRLGVQNRVSAVVAAGDELDS